MLTWIAVNLCGIAEHPVFPHREGSDLAVPVAHRDQVAGGRVPLDVAGGPAVHALAVNQVHLAGLAVQTADKDFTA